MNAQTQPTTSTPVTSAPKRGARKLVLMISVPLLLAVAGAGWWIAGGGTETTENANLHQARVNIAPTVAGRVVAVNVTELQTVKAGDVLFQVDPEPYRLALAQAEVAVSGARLQVEQLKAAYQQALGSAALAQDEAAFQQSELDRQEALSGKGVAASSTVDDSRHALKQAQDRAQVAALTVAAARAALGGDPEAATDDHPAVRAALAEFDRAQYNLSVTSVTAPADGVVYQAASFRPGAMLAAGQAVFALVETGDVWVDANFKETQLADIAPGQAVKVTFDALPGQSFAATVQAIGAGTGAEFSLLPAQNATGNWVKVTQRVPVRIKLDDPAAAAGLASGLSAKVTVTTDPAKAHRFDFLN